MERAAEERESESAARILRVDIAVVEPGVDGRGHEDLLAVGHHGSLWETNTSVTIAVFYKTVRMSNNNNCSVFIGYCDYFGTRATKTAFWKSNVRHFLVSATLNKISHAAINGRVHSQSID